MTTYIDCPSCLAPSSKKKAVLNKDGTWTCFKESIFHRKFNSGYVAPKYIPKKSDDVIKHVPDYLLKKGYIRWISHYDTGVSLHGELRLENNGSKKIQSVRLDGLDIVYGKGKYTETTYNLYNVIKNNCKQVVIVEGLKKCDTLNKVLKPTDWIAIGVKNGKIDARTEDYLKDCKVVYMPDYDEAGFKNFQRVSKSIKLKCSDISFMKDKELGYDIEDYIEHGGNLNGVLQILKNTASNIDLLEVFNKFGLPYDLERNYIHYLGNKTSFYTSSTIDTIHVQYLSYGVNLHNITERYTFISSRCCTGKTTLIKQQCKNDKIIVLSHLQSLSKKHKKDFNTMYYLDNNDCEWVKDDKLVHSRISVCIDSIYKLQNAKNYHEYTVVIDEVDQVLLKLGSISNKSVECINTLQSILQKCKRCISLSALIPQFVYKQFTTLIGSDSLYLESKVINNTYTSTSEFVDLNKLQEHYNECEDNKPERFSDILRCLMLQECEEYGNIGIGVTTKRNAQDLTLFFEKAGKTVLRIDGDCTIDRRNPETEHLKDFNVVIYTQTIFTGIDFNTGFFKRFFMLDTLPTSTYQELYQAVHRFRQVERVYALIRNNGDYTPSHTTVTNEYKKRMVKYIKDSGISKEDKSKMTKLLYETSLANKCSVECKHYSIESSKDKSKKFKNALRYYGFNEATIQLKDCYSDLLIANVELYRDEISKVLKKYNTDSFLQSTIYSDKEYKSMKNAFTRNKISTHSKLKTQVVKHLGFKTIEECEDFLINIFSENEEEKTISVDKIKNFITHSYIIKDVLLNYNSISIHTKSESLQEIMQRSFDGLIHNKKSLIVKSQLLYLTLQFYKCQQFICYTSDKTRDKVLEIIQSIGSENIRLHCFKIPIDKETKEVDIPKFLRESQKLFGFLFKTIVKKTREQGKFVRYYALDKEHLAKIEKYISVEYNDKDSLHNRTQHSNRSKKFLEKESIEIVESVINELENTFGYGKGLSTIVENEGSSIRTLPLL